MKYKFKRKPREYQRKALLKAWELNDASAIWFDPGLGKTKVALDFLAAKWTNKELDSVLVVCPISAIGVWEQEAAKDIPDTIPFKVFPVVGRKMDARVEIVAEALQYSKGISIMVMNYECLNSRVKYITTRTGTKRKRRVDSDIFKLLVKHPPDLLIIDEMHFLKNASSIRSKSIYRLRQQVKWVMGLTGTPTPKNPLDIFGQWKILDSKEFGTVYRTFEYEYSIPHPVFPSKKIGWRNLDELSKKIHRISSRVKDTEAIGLPKLIIQDVPIYFTEKTKKHYTQMAKSMIVELENMEVVTAAIAAVKMTKLQQICGGFLMRKDVYLLEGEVKKRISTFPVGTEKLDVFMDLVETYKDNHKILVGCRFIWEINQIMIRLDKKDIKYTMIRGGVGAEDRTEACRLFQTDEEYRVIIFQVSAATAVTLTAGNIGILYSCTAKWDDYFQWLKRLHREGQKRPVLILRLVVKGTVDLHIMDLIRTKELLTEEVIDKSKYRDWLTPKF